MHLSLSLSLSLSMCVACDQGVTPGGDTRGWHKGGDTRGDTRGWGWHKGGDTLTVMPQWCMHHAQLVEERGRCQCQRHRYHYLPCDCSRHFSQCTHGILDTAKGNHTSEQCMNKYRHSCLTIWLHPALFSIHTWQLGHCGTEEKRETTILKNKASTLTITVR